jgi:hypothetical protein
MSPARRSCLLASLFVAVACGGKVVSSQDDAPFVPVGSASGSSSGSVTPPGSSTGVPIGPDSGVTPPDAGTPPGTAWTSDDGDLLGLGAGNGRIYAVTQSKIVSIAPDGTDAKILVHAAQPSFFGSIAVNATNLYAGSAAGVLRYPVDGGEATLVGDSEGYGAVGVAIDATNVYWQTQDAVIAAPLLGTQGTRLATLQGVDYEDDFALVGGTLFWSTNASYNQPAQVAALVAMPVAAGAPQQTVAPGPVFSIVADGHGGVAWLEDPTPAIVDRPAGGGPTTRIALPGVVSSFTTDGSRWFWRDDETGVIWAIDGAAGTPRTLTQPEQYATIPNGSGPRLIASGGYLAWIDRWGPIGYQSYDANVVRTVAVQP